MRIRENCNGVTGSVYVSRDDERDLKKILEKIAEKKRWSFSQAVAGRAEGAFAGGEEARLR